MWLGGEVEGLDAAGAANEAEGEQDQVEDVTRKDPKGCFDRSRA